MTGGVSLWHSPESIKDCFCGSLAQIVKSAEMAETNSADLKQEGRSSMAADVATM